MEAEITPKLIEIRKLMAEHNLDAYLVTRNEPHMCERIPPSEERLRFISNFTGTNGIGLITPKVALLWTDERYYIQAPKELLPGWQMMKLEPELPKWGDWINLNCTPKSKIGYNPLLVSSNYKKTAQEKLNSNQHEFVPIVEDLVEKIWKDRPDPPLSKVFIHELKYCGEEASSKLKRIGEELQKKGADIYLITQLEEIACKILKISYTKGTLNLRGADNELTPYFISYLILEYKSGEYQKGTLYINKSKIDTNVNDYLKNLNVELADYAEIVSALKKIDTKIYLNEDDCNQAIISATNSFISEPVSIIKNFKARKNKVEVQGFLDCHRRDGAAIVRFLAWLDHNLNQKEGIDIEIDELAAAHVLTKFRQKQTNYFSKSFLVTSSFGENAAIIHYKPKPDSSAQMNNREIYLLDSGGQYLDGTTDTTRTTHFGTPSSEEIDRYTRVLLGNLDVERLTFPIKSKISGSDIDILARRHLFDVGLTYGHGTGHGVGHFLNVHEGPHGISRLNKIPLEPGMVVSNEPGFYKEGGFGIRIENILIVEQSPNPDFYRFLNVTRVPYERKLIDVSMLDKEDIDFIDDYHQNVYNDLKDILIEQNDEVALKWLETKTKKLLS